MNVEEMESIIVYLECQSSMILFPDKSKRICDYCTVARIDINNFVKTIVELYKNGYVFLGVTVKVIKDGQPFFCQTMIKYADQEKESPC